MINTKDQLYFTFKNIVNESKINYFPTIQIYCKINNIDNNIIQHFINPELSPSWWNKTIIYIYYNNIIYNIINQIISIDNDNKIKKPVLEFKFNNGIKYIMESDSDEQPN